MLDKMDKLKSHSKNNNNFKEQQPKMEKEPSEKQKKSNRKRKPDSERDKQKAELERSGNELKKLLAQFGTKAKVADEIDRDTSVLRDNIVELMTKAREKSAIRTKSRNDAAPQLTLYKVWENLMSLTASITSPFQALYQSYERFYCSINWYLFLTCILLLELSIVGLIWKFKRIQYIHMYEPYEAVVHGTYGVETTSWVYFGSIVDKIFDFFNEMRYGGRSFGSPNYDGLVPI